MHPLKAAAVAAAFVSMAAATANAQVGGAVTAPVARPASPADRPEVVEAAPSAASPSGRDGPLPANLTLARAIEEAAARSPAVVAAEAEVEAARALLRQAGFRLNPELSVDVENFAGSGPYSGLSGAETTVAINQRLDFGGRRAARMSSGQAALAVQEMRLGVARADLEENVRRQFATAVAARERLSLADANLIRARELTRIADELVAAGRDPPLRAFRARANAAQADAALRAAQAADEAARRTLSSLFGTGEPVQSVGGAADTHVVGAIDPLRSLDVRLAEAERLQAQTSLRQEQVSRRLDPLVGIGVRRYEDTGDTALVAGVSLPIPLFDRNRGNVDAARARIRSADARREAAIAQAAARIGNARISLVAAQARVTALESIATPQAGEALRLAELSYREGRLSLVELLDAQEAFAAAQSELIDARLALAEANATLARAAAR